jgi:cytoskeletal protein CcmA (bactofilin family)
MKKILIGALALLVLAPVGVSAAQFHKEEIYTLGRGEQVNEDVYATGERTTISGVVNGDVFVGSGTVVIDGGIQQDLFAAGGDITVSGTVGDDVRMAGGSITVSGTIKGDLFMAGGQIEILPSGSVEGDVVAAGGSLIIDGLVKGTVRVAGGEVRLNSQIDGDVNAATGELTLGSSALIGGDLTYRSKQEATIDDGARVVGSTFYRKARSHDGGRALAGLLGIWFVLKLLMVIITSFLLVYALRRITRHVVDKAITEPGKDALTGFILLFLVPILLIILCVTIVGIPIAIFLGFLYGAYLIMSGLLMTVVVGSYINKLITKSETIEMNWKTIFYGIVATYLLFFIPFLGWIACFVIYLIIFGALARTWYERVWKRV